MLQIERPFTTLIPMLLNIWRKTSYWTIPVLYCLGNINELYTMFWVRWRQTQTILKVDIFMNLVRSFFIFFKSPQMYVSKDVCYTWKMHRSILEFLNIISSLQFRIALQIRSNCYSWSVRSCHYCGSCHFSRLAFLREKNWAIEY